VISAVRCGQGLDNKNTFGTGIFQLVLQFPSVVLTTVSPALSKPNFREHRSAITGVCVLISPGFLTITYGWLWWRCLPPFDSSIDFIGRNAVIEQSKSKPDWRFIRLVVDIEDADAMASDPVFFEEQCVGFVSSGGSGFRTGKSIALAYIQNSVNQKAVLFEVEILGRKYPASVSPQAFYDPDNLLLR